MEIISSEQNQKIKNLIKLREKSRDRKKLGLFVVDGLREIKEVIAGGFVIEELFICSNFFKKELDFKVEKIVNVSDLVYKKISYKEKPEGILALVKTQTKNIDEIKLDQNSLILVLEAVEKPGNLGAIIRSAYAVGVDLIIINDEQTDIYNPNVIRASEGLLFKIPIISSNFKETQKFLDKNKIKTVATSLGGGKNHTEINYQEAVAIILGTESNGLSGKWLKAANEVVNIPMKPGIDSLNVSVSAAILIFEAWRQRGFR